MLLCCIVGMGSGSGSGGGGGGGGGVDRLTWPAPTAVVSLVSAILSIVANNVLDRLVIVEK